MTKLDKRQWKEYTLENLSEVTSSKRIFYSEYVSEGIPFFRSKEIIDKYNKRDIKSEIFISISKFEEIKKRFGAPEAGDILLTAVGTIGIPYIVKEQDTFYFKDGNLAWFRKTKNDLIQPDYLYLWMQSEQSQGKFKSLSSGTAQSALTINKLKSITILLPSLNEQQRIVELFQSIEQVITQTQERQKKLKLLRKMLCNGLSDSLPVFGNLLSIDNCIPSAFGECVNCVEAHVKALLENTLTQFIGLENIETDNFTLQGFGSIESGTTFTKLFSKGDVLFGKRRAYLRKVAIADFDGICSSDILVFRAIQDKMLPQLLPYYVSSDAFLNHAISTSAGSLSPRTKWRDLANFQILIPDLKTQEIIVDVMEQLNQSLQMVEKQIDTMNKLKQRLLDEIFG